MTPPVAWDPAPPTEVVRLLTGSAEAGRTVGLAEHLDHYGPLPLDAFPTGIGRHLMIESIGRAGLRGRGGAGYPTADKMRAVGDHRGRPVVVANGCEGDPTSEKDHVLLELAPHLVLDGIVLAAHALGAQDAILCVHQGSKSLIAAAQRERTTDPIAVDVVEVPPRYVASEGSALVNFLTTGDARPTTFRASERGVKGRPTLVDNVETLAHLALIARFGDAWFRRAGTPESPGSMLITVGGAVTRPGVYEIDLGLPLSDALELAGGESEPLQAVQVGGLGGSWLSIADAVDLPLSYEAFAEIDIPLGVAAIVALPARACGIAETARILRYLAAESAGQCGPCMFGLPAIADDMVELAAGDTPGDAVLQRLRRRLGVIPGRGACGHPDGAVRLAATALHAFGRDVEAHARRRRCSGVGSPLWTPLPAGAPR